MVEEERLFTLKAYGYGREVAIYGEEEDEELKASATWLNPRLLSPVSSERPQSADSRPNSAGSDGQKITGRYSRLKRVSFLLFLTPFS